MVAQRVRDYEVVIILSPEATEDEVTGILDRVDGWITERGGEIKERDVWGLKRFAYPIKKFMEGNYSLTTFKLDVGMAQALDRYLKSSEDILRALVVKREEKSKKKEDDSQDGDRQA